ncbi:MAG: serine/threonine-protein kinase, partial [Kofleriaceae bacterium]
MECLDDNTVNAYVERMLPETVRLRVAAHLDHCEVCLTITCAAARSSGGGTAATLPDPGTASPEVTRAQRVGRYALVAMIGRGGMGAVYIAHDPQLDREIALKIVRSERFADRDVRARLSREARAMAKVKHPHVVAVYDAGELDDGVFIAMELVEGETLTRWQAAPGRGWREIVRMYVAAGHGIAAAHAAGVVHRDFKPENVLVDRAGRAAVTDFGIAVAPIAMGSSAENVAAAYDRGLLDGPLTQTGTLLGTPRYMSPEQFRGQTVDARTDQFSFAVALFDALYRRAPFDGVTVGELLTAVTEGAVRDRPADTDVPVRLHRALVRALAVRPGDRYPTMTALLDALIAAASPARRGVGLAIAGVVVLVALGAVAMARRSEAPPVRPPDAAVVPPSAKLDPTRRLAIFVQPFANHTGDPRLDDILDVAVADVLYRSTRFDPAAGVELAVAATTLGGTASDVDALAKKLIEQDPRPVITAHGSITRDGTGFVLALDAQDAGRPRFTGTQRAAALDDVIGAAARLAAGLRTALGDPPPAGSTDHVLSRSVDAVHAYMQGQQRMIAGDAAGAIVHYRTALVADPELVDARSALGLTLYNLSDTPGAVAELERAMKSLDRMAERPRLMLLGDYYNAIGKYSEAIAAYEQLLARWPRDLRAEINLTASALDAADWPLAL